MELGAIFIDEVVDLRDILLPPHCVVEGLFNDGPLTGKTLRDIFLYLFSDIAFANSVINSFDLDSIRQASVLSFVLFNTPLA